MRSLFTTVLLSGVMMVATAQTPLVLNQSNLHFTTPQTIQPTVADTTGVPEPQAGTNVDWDYSGLTPTSSITYSYIVNTDANFPNTALIDTNIFRTVALGKGYYYNSVLVYDGDGFSEDGIIINEQKYGLGNVTTIPTDSFNVPAQSIMFSSPRTIVDFPATFNSAWTSNLHYDVHVNLTAAPFGLNDTDFVQRSYITQEDTVVGWGQVTLPATGGPSIPYDALMVQRTTTTVDSFFFATTPVDSSMLATFGLAQGQQFTNYREMFYRAGFPYILLSFSFGNDATFTNTRSIFYDRDLTTFTGLQTTAGINNVSVYPNPLTGSNLTFSFGAQQAAQGTIEVFNAVGAKVLAEKMDITTGINQQQVTFATDLSNGVYLYRIADNTGNTLFSGRFVK
jgi:hypothetical protein